MKTKLLIIFVFFYAISNAQLIHDESYLDSDFYKFKTELANCVMNKDIKKFQSFLAERVYESNDGCGTCTKKELINYLFDQSNSADYYWNQLNKIIRFGFIRTTEINNEKTVFHNTLVFQGPSYINKIDEENELIILGENVNIREKPNLKSKIIKKSSYEKFACDCNINTMKDWTYQEIDNIWWIAVKLKNGKYGFVDSELTSYSIIKELSIAKVNGKWKIISFWQAPGC